MILRLISFKKPRFLKVVVFEGFESVANTSGSGVISGVGKGIIASSCGLLLKTLGLTVSSIKVDPYLNIDAGLMSYVLATVLFSRASC